MSDLVKGLFTLFYWFTAIIGNEENGARGFTPLSTPSVVVVDNE